MSQEGSSLDDRIGYASTSSLQQQRQQQNPHERLYEDSFRVIQSKAKATFEYEQDQKSQCTFSPSREATRAKDPSRKRESSDQRAQRLYNDQTSRARKLETIKRRHEGMKQSTNEETKDVAVDLEKAQIIFTTKSPVHLIKTNTSKKQFEPKTKSFAPVLSHKKLSQGVLKK